MKNPGDKQYKVYLIVYLLTTILGFIFFCLGLITMVWGTPAVGVHLRTLQPIIINGSIPMLIGLVFLAGGGYRLLSGKKTFHTEKERELREKIENDRRALKNMGYSKKEIKRRMSRKSYDGR